MLYTLIWFETQNFVQSEFKCNDHDYDFSRTASFLFLMAAFKRYQI